MYLALNSIRLYFYRYRYMVRQNVLSGKCLFGQRPRARPPGSCTAHTHRAKKCLFQTHHQSPSAMTRNNYLIFVLIGWLPGCGYISTREENGIISRVCVTVYIRTPKGYPAGSVLGVSGWQHAWSMTITPSPTHKTLPPQTSIHIIWFSSYPVSSHNAHGPSPLARTH